MYVCMYACMHVCMYVLCMYVCVYVCMYVCVCMYACMCVWMDGWMDVCMYVCMHVRPATIGVHLRFPRQLTMEEELYAYYSTQKLTPGINERATRWTIPSPRYQKTLER